VNLGQCTKYTSEHLRKNTCKFFRNSGRPIPEAGSTGSSITSATAARDLQACRLFTVPSNDTGHVNRSASRRLARSVTIQRTVLAASASRCPVTSFAARPRHPPRRAASASMLAADPHARVPGTHNATVAIATTATVASMPPLAGWATCPIHRVARRPRVACDRTRIRG
jgi:hypothetical protein